MTQFVLVDVLRHWVQTGLPAAYIDNTAENILRVREETPQKASDVLISFFPPSESD